MPTVSPCFRGAGPWHRRSGRERIIVGYGFWIFLISDIILFSAFFAAYACLAPATADGPSARQIFDPNSVAVETACLLFSSFTCGLASVAASQRNMKWTQAALLVTGHHSRVPHRPGARHNVLALAFGVLIVFVLVFGTVWAMAHMNANMMPTMS